MWLPLFSKLKEREPAKSFENLWLGVRERRNEVTGQGEPLSGKQGRRFKGDFLKFLSSHPYRTSREKKKKKKPTPLLNVYQIESGSRTVLKCKVIFKMRIEKEEKLSARAYHVWVI